MTEFEVLGAQEYCNTARGLRALDAMAKAAPVSIVSVYTVNPGKYVIFITGDVASVEASVKAGKLSAGEDLVDELLLPNPHPLLVSALRETSGYDESGKGATAADGRKDASGMDAIGIIENSTIMAGIAAADAAVKKADVSIVGFRMDSHMGGRSSVKLTGVLGDVEAAVAAGAAESERRNSLLRTVIIPRPHPDIAPFIRH
ncbi:MAG: BMC domain-containing protein [Spirochaetales bacterium]|nr:MAG: BMC domain-containing protein [Spirochaetales bacterium]